jgi:hypothetical protein
MTPPAEQTISSNEPPGLTVLARLPEVSPASNRARLSEQLEWLKKLDWKRIRQMNLDPNWVAGGVLALVLVLLLVITLNRSSKPAPNAAAEAEAPSWNGGKSAAAPTTLSATPIVATANPTTVVPGSVTNSAAPAPAAGSVGPIQGGSQQGSSYGSQPVAATQGLSSAQGQFSLEGVFYPRTPHAAPAGPATHPIDHALNQPAGSSVYGRELRTAQRDVVAPHHAPMQPAVPQTGRAQFEGIISQP